MTCLYEMRQYSPDQPDQNFDIFCTHEPDKALFPVYFRLTSTLKFHVINYEKQDSHPEF